MGRLDDAAKLKVVELRKAGLSFRKIKAVLELENIKVSAQAIYLYLREFQGRPPGRVRPEDAGSSLATTQGQTRTGGQSEAWNNAQLQNLLREASHQAGRMAAAEFAKISVGSSEARANSSGSCDARGGSSREQHGDKDKEEADIQIVSVTSLAQNSQQRDLQSTMMRARAVSGAESTTTSVGSTRRRVTPSPAINPVLAARKRLLDKALSHRTKQSFQQMGPLLRRYQSSVSGDELRSAISRNPETYNLASEKSVLTGQPGGVNGPSRLVAQRPGLSARSPHPPPRVGVRFPTRAPAPLAAPVPGAPLIRLQAPGGQGVTRRDGNVSPQNAAMEAPTRSLGIAGGSGLQDQVQLLASEVRNLGLAVKMLVEQQSRLEREQVQQTRVQKQILGTLQGLSSRLGPCRSLQQQPDKTPTPPSQPTASASAPFGQDTFTYSQTTYTPCSQTQSNYNSIASLETVEAFKLPELSPSINGFPPCSNAETISNSYTQAQPYTSAYTQQHSQPVLPAYTQSFVQTYAHSNSQPFRGLESKASDFVSSCLEGSLQDCDIATELVMNSNHSPRNDQLNVIKVEEA